jgi:membrane associated rhomboid family serine protease
MTDVEESVAAGLAPQLWGLPSSSRSLPLGAVVNEQEEQLPAHVSLSDQQLPEGTTVSADQCRSPQINADLGQSRSVHVSAAHGKSLQESAVGSYNLEPQWMIDSIARTTVEDLGQGSRQSDTIKPCAPPAGGLPAGGDGTNSFSPLCGPTDGAIQQKKNKSKKPVRKEFAEVAEHRPIFTRLTFAICFILMICELFAAGEEVEGTEECAHGFSLGAVRFCIASLTMNPLIGPPTRVLVDMGGMVSHLIVEKKQLWRLVAPIYLHVGIVHFMLNMMIFLRLGTNMERKHGFFRVGTIYIISGVFAIIMTATFSGHHVSVGASGALFGLLGASVGELFQNWALYNRPVYDLVILTVSAAGNFILGTMPMLDNYAHFFGFCMGLLTSLSLLILKRVTRKGKPVDVKRHQRLIQLVAALAVPLIYVLALIVLFTESGPKICSGCDVISCIPFPWGCDEGTTCWWDCTADLVDPRCRAVASYETDERNATVTVQCPVGDSFLNMTRTSFDITRFDDEVVLSLCREMCP